MFDVGLLILDWLWKRISYSESRRGVEYKLIFLFFDEREGIECWK